MFTIVFHDAQSGKTLRNIREWDSKDDAYTEALEMRRIPGFSKVKVVPIREGVGLKTIDEI